MRIKFGSRVRHVNDNGLAWKLIPSKSSIKIKPVDPRNPSKYIVYSIVPQRMWTYNKVYLFDLGKNWYVYVGSELCVFKSLDPIQHFQVAIGNSAVRYVWAKDTKNRYYLLSESVPVAIPFRPPDELGYCTYGDIKGGIKQDKAYDPYNWYYGVLGRSGLLGNKAKRLHGIRTLKYRTISE